MNIIYSHLEDDIIMINKEIIELLPDYSLTDKKKKYGDIGFIHGRTIKLI